MMSAQVRRHLIQRRVPADLVGSPMRTNDVCAGFLARDAGKRFPGLWFRRVAGQSSEAGVFLYGEIIRLTCEKARLCRVILLYDNGVNKGMIAQIKTESLVFISERRSLAGFMH